MMNVLNYPTRSYTKVKSVFVFLTGLLVALIVGGVTNVHAQSISAYVSEDSVRIGERFYLTLVAAHESNQRPIFPSLEEGQGVFGDLEVLSIHSSGTRSVAGSTVGARVDSLMYEVTTFALDTAFVSSIPVQFAEGSDTTFYASRPFEIAVVSVVPADATDIRDIAPIIDFPRNYWPWIIGLLLLAGIVAGLIYFLGRRPVVEEEVFLRAPEPVLPPYEEAIQKLRELEKSTMLNESDGIKPYYVELTDILRTYLGRRLNINAMESTSKELMGDINKLALSTNLPDECAYLTKRILHVADLVKFADMRPRLEVGTQALMETRKVLDSVEASFKPEEQAKPPVEEIYSEDKVEHVHEE